MSKSGARKFSEQRRPSSTGGEFGRFTNLLDKLLAVPHSEIKAKLDAEKEKKRAVKRASSDHVSAEKD